jgi:hypothetical protein
VAQVGWIGVDLDGTLAHYDSWGDGSIGVPIEPMVALVKTWLAEGRTVKIVTARVCALFARNQDAGALDERYREALDQELAIKAWCAEHLGRALEVTSVKDFGMVELWDDRVVQVVKNTGQPLLRTEDLAELLGRITDKRRVM